MSAEPRLQSAADLGQAFDAAFAAPPRRPDPDPLDLLAIRLGQAPYAIRLSEISGLATRRKVVPLPCRTPELLGLAGIRGSLVPVYGLAALLGEESAHEGNRWLLLCGTREPVALAFADLEGYLRVPRSDLLPADPARPQVHEVVRGPTVHAVVSIPAVMETIHERVGPAPAKER